MISLPQAFWDDLKIDVGLGPNEISLKSELSGGSTALDDLRALGDRAGDHETLTLADGAQRALADHGGEQLTISPPASLVPPLSGDSIDVEVSSYNDGTEEGVPGYNVDLQLDRARTREPAADPMLDEAVGSTDWEFGFAFGTIAVHNPRVSGTGQRGPTRQLTMLLETEQAAVIDATLGTIESIVKRQVTGGDDYRVDAHPEDRNTVAIAPPEDLHGWFAPGEWIVTAWDIGYQHPTGWSAQVTLAETDGRTITSADVEAGETVTIARNEIAAGTSPLDVGGRLEVGGTLHVGG